MSIDSSISLRESFKQTPAGENLKNESSVTQVLDAYVHTYDGQTTTGIANVIRKVLEAKAGLPNERRSP